MKNDPEDYEERAADDSECNIRMNGKPQLPHITGTEETRDYDTCSDGHAIEESDHEVDQRC